MAKRKRDVSKDADVEAVLAAIKKVWENGDRSVDETKRALNIIDENLVTYLACICEE